MGLRDPCHYAARTQQGTEGEGAERGIGPGDGREGPGVAGAEGEGSNTHKRTAHKERAGVLSSYVAPGKPDDSLRPQRHSGLSARFSMACGHGPVHGIDLLALSEPVAGNGGLGGVVRWQGGSRTATLVFFSLLAAAHSLSGWCLACLLASDCVAKQMDVFSASIG